MAIQETIMRAPIADMVPGRRRGFAYGLFNTADRLGLSLGMRVPVDRAIYEFYDQLDQQKLAQYNPFVEPVFIRPGQFGQHAIGVFGAFALSDSLKFVYPE